MKSLIRWTCLVAAILCTVCTIKAQSIDQPDVPTGLYVRDGDKIINAPASDMAVATSYHLFKDKGPVKDGQRITILTEKLKYTVGEKVRVLHVLESVKPGIEVYIAGPKAVTDEYIDGHLAPLQDAPLEAYRGPVITRPIADFNYDITKYTFTTTGRHTIQWKGYGGLYDKNLPLESNTITIEVVK